MWNDTVRWTVYLMCYPFTESIRKLLRCSSNGSACVSGMREGEGDRERDRMQLQPLSSAAWLVAIATWLRIPFHLPFLINSHSCLASPPLSWNASPLRLTYLHCFTEGCCCYFNSKRSLFVATPLLQSQSRPKQMIHQEPGFSGVSLDHGCYSTVHPGKTENRQTLTRVTGHPLLSGEIEEEWENCVAGGWTHQLYVSLARFIIYLNYGNVSQLRLFERCFPRIGFVLISPF